MIFEKKSGHIGGSFSIAELVAFLYNEFDLFNCNKIILSKGHAVPIIYAALLEKEIISNEEINTFREINSRLQGHPVHWLLPELYATTGSLGQGLSIAVGHALSKKIKNEDGFVFCILGDGEMQEGQIYEALMFISKIKLNNLIIFLDSNGAQNDDYTENIMPLNIQELINSFDIDYYEIIDGNNYDNYLKIKFDLTNGHKPKFINLNTIKGKGVSFMEGSEWHSKIPNQTEFDLAMEELNAESN